MSRLLIKPDYNSADGRRIHITPESAGWKYVGFDYYVLDKDQSITGQTNEREVCIVLMSGAISVRTGGNQWDEIIGRKSVFDKVPPTAIYIPNNSDYFVTALDGAELGICSAPGLGNFGARLITPDMLNVIPRGKGTNTRYICDIMMGNMEADSLLVVEVKTPGGHWSSYPSHKHDQDNVPNESYLEETYFHKLNPDQGFAVQRVYNDDSTLDETMTVKNNCAVLVPEGYHPVGVPYGYNSYYLNVMAGPKRQWIFHNDPNHEWIFDRDK